MSISKPAYHALKLPALRRLARLTGFATGESKGKLLARLDASLAQSGLSGRGEPSRRGPLSSARTIGTSGQNVDASDAKSASNGAATASGGRYRVLSIDMGIRNLAFCVLEVDRSWAMKSLGPRNDGADAPPERPRSRIVEWRRLSLYSGSDDKSGAAAPEASAAASDSALVADAEAFKPAWMADLAWQVLSTLAVPAWRHSDPRSSTPSTEAPGPVGASVTSPSPSPPPDLILIERQRWRSAGSASVTEWTLRVNTLEAMLWSGLEVLRRAGLWSGVGGVRAVDPKRVASFWVDAPRKEEDEASTGGGDETSEAGAAVSGDESETGTGATSRAGRKAAKAKPRKKAKATAMNSPEIKAAKIDIVRTWAGGSGSGSGSGSGIDGRQAGQDPSIDWVGQAEDMRRAFVAERKKGGPRKKKTTTELDPAPAEPETVRKKDDLADCLLQGVAWIRWEENRRAILKGNLLGVDEGEK